MQASILKRLFLGFQYFLRGSNPLLMGSIILILSAGKAWAQSTPPLTATPVLPGFVPPELEAQEAVKIARFEGELKTLFPQALSFKEVDFLPINNGGTSFTGLVTRLLGVGLDRQQEGLRTRRFYYLALDSGNLPVGVAHGSSAEINSSLINIFAFYTAGGTLRRVTVENLPPRIEKEITEGGFLKQFENRPTADFEVTIGKKGRVKSRGDMFKAIKYPPSSQARAYFEKIFRSLRFNAAFMDVAFFITQHPDLADRTTEDFPEQISVIKGMPTSGPEAYVREKGHGSPIDGKPVTKLDKAGETEKSEMSKSN